MKNFVNHGSQSKQLLLGWLFFVFLLLNFHLASADTYIDSMRGHLSEKKSNISFLFKINNPSRQKYEITLLKTLVQILTGEQIQPTQGIYKVDLVEAQVRSISSEEKLITLKINNYIPMESTEDILYSANGIEAKEAKNNVESLVMYTIAYIIKQQQESNFKISSSLKKDINLPQSGLVQRKIYFLFGFLGYEDLEIKRYILNKIKPLFDVIEKKGFEFISVPNAKVSDLIFALNDEETLSIYWIGHSTAQKDLKQTVILDSDNSVVPKDIFKNSYRSSPLFLSLVSCYPEKILETYGLNELIENRSLSVSYTEGANAVFKDEVIRSTMFESFLQTLPNIQKISKTISPGSTYNKISFEVAGAFPYSKKYYIELNGRYIGALAYNYSSDFNRISMKIPKHFFSDSKNQITIRREEISVYTNNEADIFVRNFNVSNESGEIDLFQDQRTFKIVHGRSKLDMYTTVESIALVSKVLKYQF